MVYDRCIYFPGVRVQTNSPIISVVPRVTLLVQGDDVRRLPGVWYNAVLPAIVEYFCESVVGLFFAVFELR